MRNMRVVTAAGCHEGECDVRAGWAVTGGVNIMGNLRNEFDNVEGIVHGNDYLTTATEPGDRDIDATLTALQQFLRDLDFQAALIEMRKAVSRTQTSALGLQNLEDQLKAIEDRIAQTRRRIAEVRISGHSALPSQARSVTAAAATAEEEEERKEAKKTAAERERDPKDARWPAHQSVESFRSALNMAEEHEEEEIKDPSVLGLA